MADIGPRVLRDYALAGRALDHIFVMDAHGHLGANYGFDRLNENADDVVAIMDRIGIDILAASHLYALAADIRRGNDLMAAAVRAYPGRFLGYAVVNPCYPETMIPEVDRCFNELGMKGLKVHADFSQYPLDSLEYWRVYEHLQTHGRQPVLGHGFTADMLERAVRDFPDVPFIPAHAAAGWQGRIPDPIVDMAGEVDTIYAELCGSIVPFGALPKLVERVGAHKILFGSDVCWQQVTHAIGRILLADISDEDKKLILGLNAAKLFNIEPVIRTGTNVPTEQPVNEESAIKVS